jgi:hypothetical protein
MVRIFVNYHLNVYPITLINKKKLTKTIIISRNKFFSLIFLNQNKKESN